MDDVEHRVDEIILDFLIFPFIFYFPTMQHLLCVSLLEDSSLVVVERPLLDIMSQLPAPVRQKKFAT